MGNYQAYSTLQMNIMQADINIIKADVNIGASFSRTQADVGKFYQDQSSYNLSAYPSIAYPVSQNQGFNGWTANLNLKAGIPVTMSQDGTSESVMVQLAEADMDTIRANGGVPASIAQISAFHVKVYTDNDLSVTNWSGYDFALANLAWIPFATASDLRDVDQQSQLIGNASIATQAQAFFNLGIAAAAAGLNTVGQFGLPFAPGYTDNSDTAQFVGDLGLMAKLLSYDSSKLYNYLTSNGSNNSVQISLEKDSQNVVTLTLKDDNNNRSLQFNSDASGNVKTSTLTSNGQTYIGVYNGSSNIVSDNARVEIRTNGAVSIKGNGNDIVNLGGANTVISSGNNNTISSSTGSTTFIDGVNNGFNASSGHSVVAIGANSTAQINGTGQSIELNADGAGVTTTQGGNTVDDWGGNNFVNGSNQTVNLCGNTASPGYKQIMTLNGNNNTLNASNGSETYASGQNNTFNGATNGALIAVTANSSVTVKGTGQQVELLNDKSLATFTQTNNKVDVWGSSDEIDGVGGQAVTQGPSASNLKNNTQSNVRYASVYGPDGSLHPMAPGGSTTVEYQGVPITSSGSTRHASVSYTDEAGDFTPGEGGSSPLPTDNPRLDPVVISFESNRVSTTSASSGIPSIHDGQLSTMGWITPGEGILMQLGSDHSLTAVKSFDSLSALDTDGDSQISRDDSSWSSLRLLTTDNLGVDKLITLNQAGVDDISLQASPEYKFDHGNLISAQSVVDLDGGKYGMAADVTFNDQSVNTEQFVADFKNSISQSLTKAADSIFKDYQKTVTAPTSTNNTLSFHKDEMTGGATSGAYLADIGDHSRIALPAIFSHEGQ